MAPLRWLGPIAWSYVALVAVLAAIGFLRMDGALLTVVVVGTLPASVVAIVAGYVVIGLLGQIPGANPAHASGSGFGVVTSGARLTQAEQGPAAWFLAAGPVVLTCCFIAAALANALLAQAAVRWWRARQPGGDQP